MLVVPSLMMVLLWFEIYVNFQVSRNFIPSLGLYDIGKLFSLPQ